MEAVEVIRLKFLISNFTLGQQHSAMWQTKMQLYKAGRRGKGQRFGGFGGEKKDNYAPGGGKNQQLGQHPMGPTNICFAHKAALLQFKGDLTTLPTLCFATLFYTLFHKSGVERQQAAAFCQCLDRHCRVGGRHALNTRPGSTRGGRCTLFLTMRCFQIFNNAVFRRCLEKKRLILWCQKSISE